MPTPNRLKLNLGGASKSNINSTLKSSPAVSIALGIDFTFNTIKNVHKVNYQKDNPWYREVQDGFYWFCYCLNTECKVHR